MPFIFSIAVISIENLSNWVSQTDRRPPAGKLHKAITVYQAPPSYRNTCREPLKAFQGQQLSSMDPTGARTRLFSKDNPEAAKVGDILLVRTTSGEPFAGVCINIRKRGVDTAILLRNHLTRVGVEMWFKIYSPAVTGIEVVQRRAKRARRARLYYMRLPKHDMGSVDNIVRQYLRQRAAIGATGVRSGRVKGRDANAGKKGNKRG